MHFACSAGNQPVVELLLSYSCDVNSKNRWGRTPLVEAVHNKQTHVVHVMVNAGAKLLMDDEESSSLLCDFASRGQLDNLSILLDNEISPNLGDYDKRTALHLAAAEGQEAAVEMLLRHSARASEDRW